MMNTRVDRRLGVYRFRFAIGAILAILCVSFTVARAICLPDPQVVPPSTAKPDKARATAAVPFEMLPTNHMLVEARINGKGPYHLIFDLGAPVTLLSNRVSEATGVEFGRTVRSPVLPVVEKVFAHHVLRSVPG